ncbi:hypothetical protein ACHAWO_009173 [Cyclotella atomus]|uniref:Uncharacterized protein n=1 Tax=Cyclotella atomus TaxID=382360 RepID=A0ABD3NBK4_9STRA
MADYSLMERVDWEVAFRDWKQTGASSAVSNDMESCFPTMIPNVTVPHKDIQIKMECVD